MAGRSPRAIAMSYEVSRRVGPPISSATAAAGASSASGQRRCRGRHCGRRPRRGIIRRIRPGQLPGSAAEPIATSDYASGRLAPPIGAGYWLIVDPPCTNDRTEARIAVRNRSNPVAQRGQGRDTRVTLLDE